MKQTKPKFKQIIDAAVDVIAENGYHASQVSKIAKHAGVADGTIYLYFKNKEDILVSMFREKMGQFIEKIEQEIAEQTDANGKLLALIRAHFTQLSQDHALAIVTQLELRQSNRELRLHINEVLKGYLHLIDQIVEDGIKEGTYRSNISIRLVRHMIFGTLDETVTNWVMKDQKYNLLDQVDEVHELIVHGLSKR
ncbi:TetR/AcrR family transcriptional regulator [Radiobacillus sp. PE A8.2]|uniref:TetR/AcrR family transcriptional regulator n=1 Tax=Radiobacillus sp. PE A8.2 TaxID=3380349 RepID=UPI00388DC025